MPLRPVHCWARSRVKPMIAVLLAAYAACGSAAVVCPNTLPMLTIELPGFITRPQACAIQYEPFRLMSMTCRNCSGVSMLAGTAVPMPALLTRMSTRPNSSIARRTSALQSSGTATSVGAGLGQRLGERHPEAGGGSGDYRNLAVEPEPVQKRHAGQSSALTRVGTTGSAGCFPLPVNGSPGPTGSPASRSPTATSTSNGFVAHPRAAPDARPGLLHPKCPGEGQPLPHAGSTLNVPEVVVVVGPGYIAGRITPAWSDPPTGWRRPKSNLDSGPRGTDPATGRRAGRVRRLAAAR